MAGNFVADFYTFLDAGLTPAVYAGTIPEDAAYNCYVVNRLSWIPTMGYAGANNKSVEIWDIDCWHTSLLTVEVLRKALVTLLNGYKGAMGSSAVTGCFVDESETTCLLTENSENKLWRVRNRVRLFVNET